MNDVRNIEIGKLKTSNYVSLYPLTEREQRFSPLVEGLKNQINPFMSRREIHTLLRKQMNTVGIDTDEGHFLDKVLHFTLLQEALEFQMEKGIEAPFESYPRHLINEHLKDFRRYFTMNKDQRKKFRDFLEQVKINTDKNGIAFKGSKDPRKELHKLVDTSIDEKRLKTELAEFIQGMLMVKESNQFWQEFVQNVKPRLSGQDQIEFDNFIQGLDAEHEHQFAVYEIIQKLKKCPYFKKNFQLLLRLKSYAWETIDSLKIKHARNDYHASVSAADRIKKHNEQKERDRLSVQKETTKAEDYEFKGGNYAGVSTIKTNEKDIQDAALRKKAIAESDDIHSYERPGFVEGFIVNRIKQLLSSNKGKPLVFIDFGGQMGYSTIKLSNFFESEIKDGRLILIVTNLVDNYETVKSYYQRESDAEERQLFEKNSSLVHFLQADAQDLQAMEIEDYTGNKIPIKGNTSIVHELGSISRFGRLNDVDYPLLANILSRDGLIMTSRLDEGKYPLDTHVHQRLIDGQKKAMSWYIGAEKIATKLSEKWDLTPPIRRAVDYAKGDRAVAAYDNLHQMGLMVLDKIDISSNESAEKKERDLTYAFWMKSEAVPLKIQRYNGQWLDVSSNSFV